MNYYSDDIINNIIDNSPVKNIISEIDEFENDAKMLFFYFSFYSISLDYINNLFDDKRNKIAFCCIDNSYFNLRNCPSAMIYRKYVSNKTKEIIYYILLICTKPSFKKMGYGTLLLDGFVNHITNKQHIRYDFKSKIVVSSLSTAITYYQHYGFVLTNETLLDHPILQRYEKPENSKDLHILELDII